MQIFVEAKLLGIQEFLLAPAALPDSDASQVFLARSRWISEAIDGLPAALLTELGLSKMLVGSSGGGRFLLVLPEEMRDRANEFLSKTAQQIDQKSAGASRLIWAMTENLGSWTDIRKRLRNELAKRRGTPAAGLGLAAFQAPAAFSSADIEEAMRRDRREASEGKDSSKAVETSPDQVPPEPGAWAGLSPVSLHAAPDKAAKAPASVRELARRAEGARAWGVLRGDVDQFALRLARADSIDEHIRLSVMFKQFFAGEMQMLCSMPEYWQKVSVIYSGGDDFAIYGAWDALIGVATELERLFRRFVNSSLTDASGLEGKTITMAIALAPSRDASLGAVFEEAGQHLEAAKSAGKDSLWLLGRRLEWKQFAEALQLKNALSRMTTEFGCSPQYLNDLCGLYRESRSRLSKRQLRQTGGDRPWRYHRRIRRILHAARGSSDGIGFQKARTALIANLIGRSAVTVKLRPSGRVALEWARLAAGR